MDRANIAYAEIEMSDNLGIGASSFGLASGIFFASYCSWQVPSNHLLLRFGARPVLASCLVVWGALSTSLGFVQSAWQLYLIRLLLGFAEAV